MAESRHTPVTSSPQRPRCPNCDAANSADALFCSRCGIDLRAPDPWQGSPEPLDRRWTAHGILKALLALWAVGYAVISCSPMLATGTDAGGSIAARGLVSLVVGATLFGPWIVGLLVLGVLVWVTKG